MRIKTYKTRIFLEGEDLPSFVAKYVRRIPENSVLAITSKIAALSESRTAKPKNEKDFAELIKRESALAVRTKHAWLTIKDGMVMASAGADESNANGRVVLLPNDSFHSASKIRKYLQKKFGLKNLGVIITDSRVFPLRAGVIGTALGYAGIKGARNYIGKKDIFGRVMKISKTNVADCLASMAVLSMGEGAERMPLALITGAPVEFSSRVSKKELMISLKDDLYLPFFKNLKHERK